MKVLIATDGSACAHHAIRAAMRLLRLAEAQVFVASVTSLTEVTVDHTTSYRASSQPLDTQLFGKAAEATRLHLEAALAILAEGQIAATDVELHGDPPTELLKLAHRLDVDVIVLGSHGRGPIGRFFVGSVSEAVLHQWDKDTLVVRKPAAEAATG